jgi:hypothetical protein
MQPDSAGLGLNSRPAGLTPRWTIAFTWPTNGQSIVSFAGLAGMAQAGQ